MEFSRQEHWSGLPFPSPEDPAPGIESGSATLQADFLVSEPPGKPQSTYGQSKWRTGKSLGHTLGYSCSGYGGTTEVLPWWWQSLLSHMLHLVVSSHSGSCLCKRPSGHPFTSLLSGISRLPDWSSWLPSSSVLLSPLILVKHIPNSLLRSMQRHKREFLRPCVSQKKNFFFFFFAFSSCLGIEFEVEDDFLSEHWRHCHPVILCPVLLSSPGSFWLIILFMLAAFYLWTHTVLWNFIILYLGVGLFSHVVQNIWWALSLIQHLSFSSEKFPGIILFFTSTHF